MTDAEVLELVRRRTADLSLVDLRELRDITASGRDDLLLEFGPVPAVLRASRVLRMLVCLQEEREAAVEDALGACVVPDDASGLGVE